MQWKKRTCGRIQIIYSYHSTVSLQITSSFLWEGLPRPPLLTINKLGCPVHDLQNPDVMRLERELLLHKLLGPNVSIHTQYSFTTPRSLLSSQLTWEADMVVVMVVASRWSTKFRRCSKSLDQTKTAQAMHLTTRNSVTVRSNQVH
jgi:hypothetical protein